jgi:hypothetical protein
MLDRRFQAVVGVLAVLAATNLAGAAANTVAAAAGSAAPTVAGLAPVPAVTLRTAEAARSGRSCP